VRVTKTVFGHQRTVLVVFNENLLVAQSQTLLREIGKRQQWLRELVANLHSWRDRPPRGRKPTLEAVRKKINGWLNAQHMRQLFEVQVTERDGLPDVTYRFDQEAWQKLQDNLLGKTILFTDNDDWTDAEIVRAYRAQHHIEGAFRGIKDPHCIALRPQHHWTDQKIRVHVLTCVVALMLLSLLQRELHRQGIDCSFRRMTYLLGGIREVIIATPTTAGAKPSLRFALSRMSPEQRQIFKLLRLDRYTNAA
jgi:transposase